MALCPFIDQTINQLIKKTITRTNQEKDCLLQSYPQCQNIPFMCNLASCDVEKRKSSSRESTDCTSPPARCIFGWIYPLNFHKSLDCLTLKLFSNTLHSILQMHEDLLPACRNSPIGRQKAQIRLPEMHRRETLSINVSSYFYTHQTWIKLSAEILSDAFLRLIAFICLDREPDRIGIRRDGPRFNPSCRTRSMKKQKSF